MLLVSFGSYAQSGGTGITARSVLDGSLHQLMVDSSVTVEDSAFFNTTYIGNLDTPYTVQNQVTLSINESSPVYLRDTFSVSLKLRIYYLVSSGATDSVDQLFYVHYDSAHAYAARNNFVFSGSHKVTAKVLSVTSTATGWDPTTALLVTNQLTAFPVFAFSCSNTVTQIQVNQADSSVNADELSVTWASVLGADQYDLEWTFIDSSALAEGKYYLPDDTTKLSPALIFQNNATRVTTTATSYNIPLIYDFTSKLFIRVRPVRLLPNNGVLNAEWSSDLATPVLGEYNFIGHQPALNWQSSTSYAEQGKRKVVVQYYDGSLRNRQTVTKDNTTNTTIVGETYYDYQGRPVIQVMPSPTLSHVIAYTANFNVSINSPTYTQSNYDTVTNPALWCSQHAGAMDTTIGAGQYYSHNNPQRNVGMNQFIPDAQLYPFSETEYMPDNTGRIKRQGGVGPNYQLGSGHETKYFYGTPSQQELDGLFGTEVGVYSHYFKNMVEDANGQFSVSYVDMHGRTIATALAGITPSSMGSLPSNTGGNTLIENLSDSNSTFLQDLSVTSQKTLLVSTPGAYTFNYSMTPGYDTSTNCSGQRICYTCVYDLEITMTDNCNNQLLRGGQKFDTVIHNLRYDTALSSITPNAITVSFTDTLLPGSYVITKRLSVDQNTYVYYRDTVYMPNNTCSSLTTFLNAQRQIISVANSQCAPTCVACMESLGTWSVFWANFIVQAGLSPSDTAAYKQEALTAYQTALSACSALCGDSASADVDIENAMLQDVTPPYGQYADTLVKNLAGDYNLFHIPPANGSGDTIAVFQLPQITYVDADGNPDSVYLESSGIKVIPNLLSRDQFIANFQPSWAYGLLPYHPEYGKLKAYQGQHLSNLWDRKMEAIDHFSEAYCRGYLNPTGNSGYILMNSKIPSRDSTLDPFGQENNTFLSDLNAQLSIYLQGNSGKNPPISMWGLACALVKCQSSNQACIDAYAQAATAPNTLFDTTQWCQGDLDQAWKNFRQLYLTMKQSLMDNLVIAPITKTKGSVYSGYDNLGWPGNRDVPTQQQLFQDSLHAEFNDASLTAKGGLTTQQGLTVYAQAGGGSSSAVTAAQTAAQYSLDTFYSHNANAVAQQWALQLSPCNYSSSDVQDTILPRLTALSQMATDAQHPTGASSLPAGETYTPAGTTYRFTSFQDILNAYNTAHHITTSTACNAELINIPAPYNSAPSYGYVSVTSRPTDCECTQITRQYQIYQLTQQGDASFSAYLQRTQQITMSESDLDQLLSMCNNSTNSTCLNVTTPILLPPAFQCGTGSTCVPCQVVDSLDSVYNTLYPRDSASITDTLFGDTAQYAKNVLFQNFMNNRLGFNLQASDYLNFMSSCAAQGSSVTLKCTLQPIGNIFSQTGSYDQLGDIEHTPDNGYILAGATTSGAGSTDGYVVKTDQSGNVQWAKAYGGSNADTLVRIRPTLDNGYIAVGSTLSGRASSSEMMVVKMDFYGNVQWTRIIGFNTASGEYGRDIIQTDDGGYAVLGSYNYAGGTADLLLTKLDTGGHVTWTKEFGSTSSDEATNLIEQQDTLIITGSSYISPGYIGDVYKFSPYDGTNYHLDTYSDVSDTSTWFGSINPTASGYRIYMINTAGFTNAGKRIAYTDISVADSIQDYVRIALPPGGNSVTNTGLLIPTLDGGTLVGQTGDVTPHIYWQKLSAADNVVWSSVTNLPGTQTVNRLLLNSDSTFTNIGLDGNNPLFLKLNNLGQTGCYDSSVNMGVSYPSLALNDNVPTQVYVSLTPTGTDTTFTSTTLTPSGTGITCPGNTVCYNIYSGPMLCGRSAPLFPPASLDSTTTCTDSAFFAYTKGTALYNNYNDSLIGNFEATYNNVCLQAAKTETFTVSHVENEYHYTLYYYDQAGNLVKTVPPAGVHPDFDTTWYKSVEAAKLAGTVLVPNDSLQTNYRYNTVNQVVSQVSPDGGQSSFWYDRLGRLAVSQNALQASNQWYSYTLYDSISRITEVGQLANSSSMAAVTSRNAASLASWINGVASTKNQITQTMYDTAYGPLSPEMLAQNLRNRVAYSTFFGSYSDINNASPTQATASYYSYDILGNIDTLILDYRSGVMNSTNNRFKKIVYDYDLQSGKVDKVAYQHGYSDAFYHNYLYDAENRLTNILTSADSINWDNDAFYSYYLHGPLSRIVLGDQQVQGINHAYTLQGWTKSVNPPIQTIGSNTLQADGISGSPVAANAYNLQLNYFNGDYIPVSGLVMPVADSSNFGVGYNPLYNGNISSMGVSIASLKHPLLYNYGYDQLNRLIKMDAWNSRDSLWSNIGTTPLSDFQERVTYDPNGNILKYKRNGNNTFAGQPLGMDSLNYAYAYGTNKLDHISDSVPSGNYSNDLDNQSSGNYSYDAIGELTGDNASGISNISWTVYGKIQQITKSTETISFTYDAAGNRISKTVAPTSGTAVTTWYVRDAQGNIMSVYTSGDQTVNSGDLSRTEIDLYGSDRLGTIRDSVDVAKAPVYTKVAMGLPDSGIVLAFMRGYKLFELSNHLGNVLATISDKKYGVSLNDSLVDHYIPQVVSANDYYPFGSQMPGRDTTFSGNFYRFGFQGKESDNEVKGMGDQIVFENRIYDPRVGRFLSLDPLRAKYPMYSPYHFSSNQPIHAPELDGLESSFDLSIPTSPDKVDVNHWTLNTQHKNPNGLQWKDANGNKLFFDKGQLKPDGTPQFGNAGKDHWHFEDADGNRYNALGQITKTKGSADSHLAPGTQTQIKVKSVVTSTEANAPEISQSDIITESEAGEGDLGGKLGAFGNIIFFAQTFFDISTNNPDALINKFGPIELGKIHSGQIGPLGKGNYFTVTNSKTDTWSENGDVFEKTTITIKTYYDTGWDTKTKKYVGVNPTGQVLTGIQTKKNGKVVGEQTLGPMD